MSTTIKLRRGLEAGLPALAAGEPAFTTDTHKLYVGTNGTTGGNRLIADGGPVAANVVWAGPASGGSANPSWRALVAADIPDLSGLYAAAGGNFAFVDVANTFAADDSQVFVAPTTLGNAAIRILVDSTGLGYPFQVVTDGVTVCSINENGTVFADGAGLTNLPAAELVGSPGDLPAVVLPASLAAVHGLTPAADRFVYYTSPTAAALGTVTPFARTLLDDASALTARGTLGLGTAATESAGTWLFATSNLSDLPSPSTARANLGLGTLATQAASSVAITGGSVTGITDLAVADGGTGASTAAAARANLGLAIGADVQAYDATLAALSAFNANGLLTQTAADTFAARSIAAGSGVAVANGSGVAGNPTVGLDVPGLTAEASPADADSLPVYDDSAAAHRRVTVGHLRKLITAPGTLAPFAGGTVPSGWLECDGASVSRTTYADLYAAVGTTWGSVDGSSFNVPDLRGRTLIGAGAGSGLTARTPGQTGGSETHTLSVAEMPAHSHTNAWSFTAGSTANVLANGGASSGTSTFVNSTGGGGAHNNMPPYGVAKWVIKT